MRLSIFLIFPLLALALGGCNNPQSDELRFALSSAPVTLDPRFATDATSSRINRLIYRQLVDFDETLQPVPDLAHCQPVNSLHYRCRLIDQTATFHHERPLTAEDVAATYRSVLDPETASPHRATLAMVERIETPDRWTVDFYLNKAAPLFVGYLVLGILPADDLQAGHPFSHQPLGAGPFEFVDWPDDGRLVLRRLVDGQSLAFIKVQDPTVRALKLLRGEVDMLQNDMPPELVSHLQQQGMTLIRQQGANFSYLGFNLEDPVTGQLLIRQAIAYALDRQQIIDYVFGGAARPATSLLPPQHWAGHPNLPQYTHDPQRARALLQQWQKQGGELPRLSYKTSNNPFRVRLATVIQHQLAQVGIEVAVQSYDWGTFYGDIKQGLFQMFSLAWVGIKTPDIYRYVFHSQAVPPNGANRGRYQNPEVDRLIERAEQATDPAEMASNYRRLQQILHDELPYVPLWYEDHVFIAAPGVTGYTLSPDGNYDGLKTVTKQ